MPAASRAAAPATNDARSLIEREDRAARRLIRLLRLEATGRGRRISDQCLAERRRGAIAELLRLDAERRAGAAPASTALDRTLTALAEEIGPAEQRCRRTLVELSLDLARLRGQGAASGLRDRDGGRLLGSG